MDGVEQEERQRRREQTVCLLGVKLDFVTAATQTSCTPSTDLLCGL